MSKEIYVDVGSSTIKVYEVMNKKPVLVETKSIHFKEDFDPAFGLTNAHKDLLIEYIESVKNRYDQHRIKIFATAIFRKMSDNARRQLVDEMFSKTGLYFNIVSHDLEGFYLEMALSSSYVKNEPFLLINIGGGSTELIVKRGGEIQQRYNLDIGVMSVVDVFPFINDEYSKHTLEDVVAWVRAKLPQTQTKAPFAIYNGGELTYMNLLDYALQRNDVFNDAEHPFMVTRDDFSRRNAEVFSSISLHEMEEKMPNDPQWMHGARACSAIAQAVVESFGVVNLVPSDSNMIHGTVKQEYRKVVLSGSFRKHLEYILSIKKQLNKNGVSILSPRFEDPKNPTEEFVIFDGEEGMSPLELERYHLDMINASDALIVCSQGGYVGASALIEIGYAQEIGKRIIFTEEPEEFMLRTLPAEVGL